MTPASRRTGTRRRAWPGSIPGRWARPANCQVGVSVHLVGERASCAADWRLFCPESWDDKALDDPVQAARGAAPPRAGPHPRTTSGTREKWRLALEMLDEMTGPGGWGVAGAGRRGRRHPARGDR